MVPGKLNKDIDDLKSPSNKVLVRFLVIAVIALACLYYKTVIVDESDCKTEQLRLRRENDSLKNDAMKRSQLEYNILLNRINADESLNKKYEALKRHLQLSKSGG